MTLLINAVVSAALYSPFGIAGVVIGTVVSTMAMTVGQATFLRRKTRRARARARRSTRRSKILIASAILGVVAYGTWYVLDQALGRSLLAQLISVGGAITLGSVVYAGVVLAMRVPEARQIVDLFARRFRGAS